MNRYASLVCLCTALSLAPVLASAATPEVYRWVDERGVTNYGSAPPAQSQARPLDPQAARVSVYTPPPGEARALEALMRDRIARLEQQLQLERRERERRSASLRTDSERRQLAYEQCQRDRRIDCDAVRDGYATPARVLYVGAPLLPRAPFAIPPVYSTPTGYAPSPPGMHHRDPRDTGRRPR